ncbi:MAG: OmpH family outer membrane protein [Prevotella sp.]|jgi:Outer membrane protein (OmpH-like).|nr:OmpH family outer membrane protein [Prevotella sp.]
MKKTFFLAMAAALAMTSCNNGGNNANQNSNAPQSSELKIAYVDIEELDSTYKFCTDFKAEFEKKTKNADNTLNQKGQALQNQAAQFQQNLQNNKYTQQQAQSVNASLQKQQADLQQLQQRLAAELQAESEKYTKALRDSVQHFLVQYNKDKKYSMILSKAGDNVLYSDKSLDITKEVVAGLNKAYKPAAKAAEPAKAEEKK